MVNNEELDMDEIQREINAQGLDDLTDLIEGFNIADQLKNLRNQMTANPQAGVGPLRKACFKGNNKKACAVLCDKSGYHPKKGPLGLKACSKLHNKPTKPLNFLVPDCMKKNSTFACNDLCKNYKWKPACTVLKGKKKPTFNNKINVETGSQMREGGKSAQIARAQRDCKNGKKGACKFLKSMKTGSTHATQRRTGSVPLAEIIPVVRTKKPVEKLKDRSKKKKRSRSRRRRRLSSSSCMRCNNFKRLCSRKGFAIIPGKGRKSRKRRIPFKNLPECRQMVRRSRRLKRSRSRRSRRSRSKPSKFLLDKCMKKNKLNQCKHLCKTYKFKPACAKLKSLEEKKSNPSMLSQVAEISKNNQPKNNQPKNNQPKKEINYKGKMYKMVRPLNKNKFDRHLKSMRKGGFGGLGREMIKMEEGAMKKEILKTLSESDVRNILSNEKCSDCNFLGSFAKKCKGFCCMGPQCNARKMKKEGFSNMDFTRNCFIIILMLIIVFLFKKEIMNFLK